MYEKILFTIIRGITAYIFAMVLTRLMGRKLISQMTFFDFVVGVSMGSIVANLFIGSDNTPAVSATALTVLALLAVVSGIIDIRSFRVRKLVNSEPVTLIDKGSIVEDNMKKVRLTIDGLNMKLREKNVFSLADVEFAIMETDGQLSVLQKPEKLPLTPSDMSIKKSSSGLMRDIIIDGNIMEENLNSAGLNLEWLQTQLSAQGIQNPSEVFYAGVDSTQRLYLSKKNAGNTEGHGKYGIE